MAICHLKKLTLVGILFLLQCAPTTSDRQVEQREIAQATQKFEQAEMLFQQKDFAQSQVLFEEIFSQYPYANVSDNAMLRFAQTKAIEKDFAMAGQYLERLIQMYADSDVLNHAHRDRALIAAIEKDCSTVIDHIFETDLTKLSSKDQAKLSSKAQTCIAQTPTPWFVLAWDMTKFQQMDSAHPLHAQTKDKIIRTIEIIEEPEALERIIKAHPQSFPSGYASYRLTQIYSSQNQNKKVQQWALYFQQNFPMHPKAQILFEEIQISTLDTKSDARKIGVLLPLSGKNENIGRLVLNGITQAIGTFGNTFDPNAVELIVEDTQSKPETARQKIKKLIYTDQVVAIIGPLSANETQSVADIAEQSKIPLITLTPQENITQQGQTIFQNSITKKEQAIGLAQLAVEILNIKRMAILYPESSYGKEFMQLFWKEFESQGGQIHGAEFYQTSDTQYSTPIQKLVGLYPRQIRQDEICSKRYETLWYERKKANQDLPNCYPRNELPPIIDFEAVLIPDGHHRARQIIPALKYHDVRGVQVLGTNLWNDDNLLEGTTQGELEGVLFMDAFFTQKKSPVVQQFVSQFYTNYGYEPSILEAQGFDSAQYILSILKTKRISSGAKLITEMQKHQFQGVTGLVSFSNQREAIRKLTALTVHESQITELY